MLTTNNVTLSAFLDIALRSKPPNIEVLQGCLFSLVSNILYIEQDSSIKVVFSAIFLIQFMYKVIEQVEKQPQRIQWPMKHYTAPIIS